MLTQQTIVHEFADGFDGPLFRFRIEGDELYEEYREDNSTRWRCALFNHRVALDKEKVRLLKKAIGNDK